MTNPQIEAARAYEKLFVPALFQQWTDDVLDLARVGKGDRVLDIACGTGVLARAAAERGATVTGLDLNPGMLAVARELAPDLTWVQGSADELPFEDNCFDAVVSQFGMMFFPDRVGALREMMRVSTPSGHQAVAVWDRLEQNGAYVEEVELLERLAGERAADALRAPFVLGDRDHLKALALTVGIQQANVATLVHDAVFPSIDTMVEADLRGWLPVMGVHLDEATIREILEAAPEALAPYQAPSGEVIFPSTVLVLHA